jgi:hypothetical protein
MVTLIGGGDEWIALTPEGFFNASSPSAAHLLAIVRGLESNNVEQVWQSLFNPDLVREKLAGDRNGEVTKAAQIIDLEKVLNSGPAPSVAITSPAEGSTSPGDLVTVTALVEDKGKGIGRLEWRVNGITAGVEAKAAEPGTKYTLARELALEPGDNVVELVAYNASNLLASLPARTIIRFAGTVNATKSTLHVLAIGINAYDGARARRFPSPSSSWQ